MIRDSYDWRRLIGVILALVSAGLLSVCSEAPDGDAAVSTTESEATESISAAEPISDPLPEVVARVNGLDISREEFERGIRAAETKAQQVVPPQFKAEIYRNILDRLVAFHLLRQESIERGLEIHEEEVDDEIDRIRSSFQSAEAFDQRLSDWQTSIELLRKETRNDLLIARVIELEVAPKLSLDEESVRAFYGQHPDQFTQAAAVRASHILIGVEASADGEAKSRARVEAEAVRREAASGADFAALAREHSSDSGSAPKGGDLGFVTRGQSVPPFDEALFALKAGEISDLVESVFGFHIIYAVESRPERVLSYEEASGQIRVLLLQQKRDLLAADFLEDLRARGEVEIYI